VEVISGAEEARLIHLGVQLRWPHPDKKVLLIDIGGGSAELILSDHGTLVEAFSKPLGAVRLQQLFLKSDPPSKAELGRMHEYIEQKVERPAERIGRSGIDRVIATAASASAIVSAVHRVSREERDQCDRQRATLRQVRKLYELVVERDLAGRRKIAGIGPRRAEIIIPGVTVLMKALERFGQPAFYYSVGGVRDGIIADLYARRVGRELSMLSREQRQVVEQLARRYGVELRHARKVADLAHALFAATANLHGRARGYGKLLQAAALLKDVGHFVSDSRHHKHTYYLVANSALPGFTDAERELIANLARYHRKSMPTALHQEFQSLSPDDQDTVRKLAPLLRLADGLDRSQRQLVQSVDCRVNGDAVNLRVQSNAQIDLEIWAAEQTRELFRQYLGRNLVISRK
jgi:exopolyphosphatase/guanosine-5'-triphosphate,3'-diphosphate pyrophosphatase